MHKPFLSVVPQPINKTVDFLEALKVRGGFRSDYALAAFLGVSRQTLSQWQSGTHFPGVQACFLIADELGMEPQKVIADVELERATSKGADPVEVKMWKDFATRIRNGYGGLGSLVAWAFMAVILSVGITASPDASAMAKNGAGAPVDNASTGVCIVALSDSQSPTTVPPMLTLYYVPATCALATHLALEFAQADYQAVRLDFSCNEQQSAAYLRVNPKGRVPALVTPRGVLTETPALLDYVARTHPDARLAPLGDTFAMARCHEINAYLCSTVHVAHAHKRRGARWSDDPEAISSMQRKVTANMHACFSLIERDMVAGPWVFGDDMSVSDLYLYTLGRWLEGDGVDISDFPKVAALSRRLDAHPLTHRVLDLA